jgi:hypothetical protein
MQLRHGLHLAYCTNVHRGENWAETFAGLDQHTLAVRRRVGTDAPFAIGLRLSNQAAVELSEPAVLLDFQRWLGKNDGYVFTINGFPFGRFHGGRVKEQVFAPDWAQPERLDYTNRLFNLLAQLVPPGVEGSVSTLPGSFKEFVESPDQIAAIRKNLWSSVEHIARLTERSGRVLHLGVEPEPLGLFENTAETIDFFSALRDEHPGDPRLNAHLGVNYDTCHFALQYESAREALDRFRRDDIRISKLHLSSALKVRSTPETCAALGAFVDEVYLHQVIVRAPGGELTRLRDLDLALARAAQPGYEPEDWRIHFHIPLHSPASALFDNTSNHLLEAFDVLRESPALCSHLEIETYTWEVLPPTLKNESVVNQLVREYEWSLEQLTRRGLAN